MEKFDDSFRIDIENSVTIKHFGTMIQEPVAFRNKAEPNWRGVLFIPYKNGECLFDTFSINEWAFLTTLRVHSSKKDEEDRYLIRNNYEVSLPVLPKDYAGPFNEYFAYLKNIFPKWNGIPPMPIVYGCISPQDNRTLAEIKDLAVKSYFNFKNTNNAFNNIQNILSYGQKPKGELN